MLTRALTALILVLACSVQAAHYYPGVSPANLPWPGGVVPYEFDPAVSSHLHQIYLDGIREWELAGNISFIPHTTETNFLLLKYDPTSGINQVYGINPVVMRISSLTRGQVVHESGHALGLEHEHVRSDRDTFIRVFTNNICCGAEFLYTIVTNGTAHGAYDHESVMHYSRNLFSIDPANLNVMEAKPPYGHLTPRISNSSPSPGDRAAIRDLYGPGPSLTSTVTSTGDGGTGSFRAAIFHAKDNPGTTITFNISTIDPGYSNGIWHINISADLPPIALPGITIDATTQTGYSNNPVIVLSGVALLPEAGLPHGLLLYSSNCVVRGLAINRFPNSGITMLYTEAVGNSIEKCFIGTSADGLNAEPNSYHGVLITDQAGRNIIGSTNAGDGNLISGNTQYGIIIVGSNTGGNVISGNTIGLDRNGTQSLANGFSGIGLFDGTTNNLVGGSNGMPNVISGNTQYGILIIRSNTYGNIVAGNLIGTDRSGYVASPNALSGINLALATHGNRIGGPSPADRNIISGNAEYGVLIVDSGTTGNVVRGNFIGTDANGMSPLPNQFSGVGLFSTVRNNVIGPGNLISGNNTYGILIAGAGTGGHHVFGNYIGTDITVTNGMPNMFGGIILFDSTTGNVIGGSSPGEINVISGNSGAGILLFDPMTYGNRIIGNRIGSDASGNAGVPNIGYGIYLASGASSNLIGGKVAGEGNVIAFNTDSGILLLNSAGRGNAIRGNTFYSNGFHAVDLNGGINITFGTTANDPGDTDTGPNDLQNYPRLTNTIVWGPAMVLQGVLESRSNRVYEIDFFRSEEPDFIGYGEGQYYLGYLAVTTDVSGLAAFSFGHPTPITGSVISATATDMSTGDTSEFSSNRFTHAGFTGPGMPELKNLTVTTGGIWQVTVALDSGWPYRLQSCTDLVAQVWSTEQSFIVNAPAISLAGATSSGVNRLDLRFTSP